MTMVNRRTFKSALAAAIATLILMPLFATDSRALEPWTSQQQQVVNRINSGLSEMKKFTGEFEKARPPVSTVTRGPLAVKNYVDRLKELSLVYRKSYGYRLHGDRSVFRRVRIIKRRQNIANRNEALLNFAKRLQTRHASAKGKLIDYVKDSPDRNRVKNHADAATGKFAEAVNLAQNL